MTSGGATATQAAVLALVGVLGGSIVSGVVGLLTLRLNRRAENERQVGEHGWQSDADLRSARRKAYTKFLERQNAIIMSAGEVRDRAGHAGAFTTMPEPMRSVYEELQNAYAESLLLSGRDLRRLLLETQEYLDGLVWASWKGRQTDARDGLYNELLDAMQGETVSPAILGAHQQGKSN